MCSQVDIISTSYHIKLSNHMCTSSSSIERPYCKCALHAHYKHNIISEVINFRHYLPLSDEPHIHQNIQEDVR